MSAPVLTIGGVTQSLLPGWSIDAAANWRATFTFRILSYDGSYRAALDQEVILTEGGVKIFAGFITRLVESGLEGENVPEIETLITAGDYNVIADRRFILETPLGGFASTLKAQLTQILPYFQDVYLHAGQVDGPVMPERFYYDVLARTVLDELTLNSGGYLWQIDNDKALRMYLPGTVSAPFNITLPNCLAIGDVIVEPDRDGFANGIIVRTTFDRVAVHDAVAQTPPLSIVEALYTADDSVVGADLVALANLILARSLVQHRTVRYPTWTRGLFAGMSQTIVLPARNLNNTFLITAVRSHDLGPDVIEDEVTAIEGDVFQTGWREKWQAMTGGGAASGIAIGGGGGGTTTTGPVVYWLGGSQTEAVQTTSGAWIPASSVEVTLDTVALGRTTGTVSVQLRADAGTVTARFRNVSDGVTAGTSGAGSGAAYGAPVTIAITLTPGSKRYRLELSPSVSDVDIAGMGYAQI